MNLHAGKKFNKYFSEDTGLYIDWAQLKKLPEIDTLIDIGVGTHGTTDLYDRFPTQKLVLIDPLEESHEYIKNNLKHRDKISFKTALGRENKSLIMNIEKENGMGRSTFLKITDLNNAGSDIEERNINITTLDSLINDIENLGRIGIKIDTEGYELEVILGAEETLKTSKFVIAEVRHNHESFEGCYKLHEFIEAMRKNDFQLSMIFTAKPLIADLCFQPINDLNI